MFVFVVSCIYSLLLLYVKQILIKELFIYCLL